jgi:hypothetical protein
MARALVLEWRSPVKAQWWLATARLTTRVKSASRKAVLWGCRRASYTPNAQFGVEGTPKGREISTNHTSLNCKGNPVSDWVEAPKALVGINLVSGLK